MMRAVELARPDTDRYPHEPGVPRDVIEYLDGLPFPVTELAERRGLVCDYCFFGGPDEQQPLGG